MFGAGGEAGAGHAFAQAAFLEKIALQAPELLVKQVVGLVNQADEDVSHYMARTAVDEFTIGLIGRIGRSAEAADVEGFLGILVPERSSLSLT